jgi:hypothetical protein
MSVFSYLITFLGIIFWVFRAVITAMSTNGVEFMIQPLNVGIEIALLFITIICMIFVLKRNIIGAVVYMALYVSYFGTAIYNSLNGIVDENHLSIIDTPNLVVSIIGIAISVLTFIDILFNKNRKAIIGGKSSTDWYYKNKDYDRQLDKRADTNQYKIK